MDILTVQMKRQIPQNLFLLDKAILQTNFELFSIL